MWNDVLRARRASTNRTFVGLRVRSIESSIRDTYTKIRKQEFLVYGSYTKDREGRSGSSPITARFHSTTIAVSIINH